MKRWAALLVTILVLAVCLPIIALNTNKGTAEPDEFYFGVSFGDQHAEEALPLIDKVKDYTNLFLIGSWNVTTNQTALNMVCDYAAESGLNFIVYFDFISRIAFPWHQQWLDTAKQRWGDKFLGVYLRDEPGGKQIEAQEIFTNASSYEDAAAKYVNVNRLIQQHHRRQKPRHPTCSLLIIFCTGGITKPVTTRFLRS